MKATPWNEEKSSYNLTEENKAKVCVKQKEEKSWKHWHRRGWYDPKQRFAILNLTSTVFGRLSHKS